MQGGKCEHKRKAPKKTSREETTLHMPRGGKRRGLRGGRNLWLVGGKGEFLMGTKSIFPRRNDEWQSYVRTERGAGGKL